MHLLWNVGNNSGILEDLKNDKGPERQQNIDHAQSIGEFDLILKYSFLKPPQAVYRGLILVCGTTFCYQRFKTTSYTDCEHLY